MSSSRPRRLASTATALALALTGPLALPSSATAQGAPTPCRATAIDAAAAQRLMDHVERAYGREPRPRGYFDLQSATAALVHRGRCLTAVTLSYDRELGGGMVIL